MAEQPSPGNGLECIDTVIVDGRIDWVDYEDKRHHAPHIGIQQVEEVPTFDGSTLSVISEFAFVPEMNRRIEWDSIVADVRYAISDSPVNPRDTDKSAIQEHHGLIISEFHARRGTFGNSEKGGYLWTDEEFSVGNHSILEILKEHVGEYIHLEIKAYRQACEPNEIDRGYTMKYQTDEFAKYSSAD